MCMACPLCTESTKNGIRSRNVVLTCMPSKARENVQMHAYVPQIWKDVKGHYMAVVSISMHVCLRDFCGGRTWMKVLVAAWL